VTTFRSQHDKNNPYFIMGRTAVHDDRLSFKAVGLLTYLLSKPDNWETILTDLVKHHTDGESSVRSGLGELKTYGYIVHSRERGEDGKYVQGFYDVHESPQGDFPDVDNPDVDNPPLVSNDEVVNKETTTTTASASVKEVAHLYESIMGRIVRSVYDGESLADLSDTFPINWITEAFQITMDTASKPSLAYARSILERWKREGKSTAEKQAEQEEEKKSVQIRPVGGDAEWLT